MSQRRLGKYLFTFLALILVLGVAVNAYPSNAQEATATKEVTKPGDTGDTEELSLAGKTIGVAVLGTDHFWDREAFNGAIAKIEELGGTAIGVDAERDDQKHIANHENLLAQKVDAIVSILGATDVMAPVFKKIAQSDSTLLFTVDQPTQWSINNSTSDNYFMGSTIGRYMAAAIGGKGKVAVFNGFGGLRICETRYEMWKYVLQDYPGIQIIEPELQDVIPNTQEDARQKTADLLLQYPPGTLDAIHIGCWDIPAIGVVQALEEAGRTDVVVTGLDGGPETLEIMADPASPFVANIAQQPAKIAGTSVENIARHFAGQELPKTTYVDVLPVTKENAQEVYHTLGYDQK